MSFIDKIKNIDELAALIADSKKLSQKVIHCHGTFDLLHPGHLRYFQEAKALGDVLIVTITADHFVNKGPGRPVYNQSLRAESIASLEYVDYVGINNHADAIALIRQLQPDLYVKGADYKDHSQDKTGKISLEVESVKSVGGDVYYTSNEVTFSSSQLLKSFFRA